MRTNRNWVTRNITTAVILACILLPIFGFAADHSVNEQLLWAAENGSLEQTKTLLAKGGEKFLIDKGLDVNAETENGETALSRASEKNKPEVVEYLEAHGAK